MINAAVEVLDEEVTGLVFGAGVSLNLALFTILEIFDGAVREQRS